MMILNKPECKKCGKPAMSLVHGMWLCGHCVEDLSNKIKQLKEKILLEE